MADNDEASLGARLLIIVYGLGIVLIGAYPIQREYGSVLSFLKERSTGLLGTKDFSTAGEARRAGEERARLKSANEKAEAEKKKAATQSEVAAKKNLDGLTKKDRKELSNLLESIK